MEANWLEAEEMPLYAAVKAAQVLERLQQPLKEVTAMEPVAGLTSTDRTASILTFRVRFDSPTTSPDETNYRIHRKAN